MINRRALFVIPLCFISSLRAEVRPGMYDMATVRDKTTLETRVIEDWHPWSKDPSIRQKLVEITVCEWWPGQKVRLPVTFIAQSGALACKNMLVGNSGIVEKAASLSGAMLRLVKENNVGVVLIGMTTIDAMVPVGKLDAGMKENFLRSKDARYTPAWIWGLSDMRALTAAITEKEVFQPVKVLVTGGSKRGVGAAAACIADDRFTAMMPVVAPIIDPPGGPYVEGLAPKELTDENAKFLEEVSSGANRAAPVSAIEPLVAREKIRAAERITKDEAVAVGWNETELRSASTLAWEVCRTTNHLPTLAARGAEIFYIQGTNDNVSPGLREIGKHFPNLPIYVVPGGQHGGAKATGFTKQVGSLVEVDENLFAFAQHHFFNARSLPQPPKVTHSWDSEARKMSVHVALASSDEDTPGELWWSINRHADYTFAMEYDTWQSTPMHRTGPQSCAGEAKLPENIIFVDFVTVHKHTENGSTLTYSSPLLRMEVR